MTTWRLGDEEMSAIAAARDEAARLGYALDDRILFAYRERMVPAVREQVARDIEASRSHPEHKPTCVSCITEAIYIERSAAIARGGDEASRG